MAISKEWSHTRSVLRKTYNKEVVRYFGDLPEDQEPDNVTGRSSLKRASLIGATESMMSANIKMMNFIFSIKQSHNKPAIYGTPVTNLDEEIKYNPQVALWFREKISDARIKGRVPIRARVSFRVLDQNISKAEVQSLANKIKAKFGEPLFSFNKGKVKFSYRDKERGYAFILATDDEADARKVIDATLELQDHVPDWELLFDSTSNQSWAKKTKQILGQTVEMPVKRPIGKVWFTHAELKIHGLNRDIILCDATRNYPGSLTVV